MSNFNRYKFVFFSTNLNGLPFFFLFCYFSFFLSFYLSLLLFFLSLFQCFIFISCDYCFKANCSTDKLYLCTAAISIFQIKKLKKKIFLNFSYNQNNESAHEIRNIKCIQIVWYSDVSKKAQNVKIQTPFLIT